MKVVFAHDHVFLEAPEKKYYSTGSLNYKILSRYLEYFDHMFVVARTKRLPDNFDVSKLNQSSGPNISFISVPSLSSPLNAITKRKIVYDLLEDCISKSDGLIARLPSEVGSLAIQIARRSEKPWIAEVVGNAWDGLWNYGNWKGKVYAPVMTIRTKALLKQSPFAIYVTREFLQRCYPCKGVIASCSDVEITEINEDILTQRLNKIRLGSNPLKIGLIGALSSNYKGIDTALKAIHIARDKIPNLQLHILGGGEKSRWIELSKYYGLAESTFFCGTLPGGEPVFKWLDDIDVYIQPSKQEGLPRALIEAMSRGCPTLGSTVGGIPELIDDDCLHSPGDSRKLSDLLIKYTQNKYWLEQKAITNFKRATNYTKPILDDIRKKFFEEFSIACKKRW